MSGIKSKPWYTLLQDTMVYCLGSALISLSLYTFALNANFAPGGIAGIAVIVHHFTGLPIGAVSLVLNIPMAITALVVVGRKFLAKSIWALMITTWMMDFVFPHFPTYHGNPLLAALFTGVCLGAGSALMYMRGASTGGLDFIVMSIRKRRPQLSLGSLSLVFQLAVVVLGGIVYRNIDSILYGILCGFATTLTMNKILLGVGSGKAVFIITGCGAQIVRAIGDIPRGATIIRASGGYTGQQLDIVLCFCTGNEVQAIRKMARQLDGDSMVMVTESSEILGRGFPAPQLPGSEDAANTAA